jgi:hypothetical protein
LALDRLNSVINFPEADDDDVGDFFVALSLLAVLLCLGL